MLHLNLFQLAKMELQVSSYQEGKVMDIKDLNSNYSHHHPERSNFVSLRLILLRLEIPLVRVLRKCVRLIAAIKVFKHRLFFLKKNKKPSELHF